MGILNFLNKKKNTKAESPDMASREETEFEDNFDLDDDFVQQEIDDYTDYLIDNETEKD